MLKIIKVCMKKKIFVNFFQVFIKLKIGTYTYEIESFLEYFGKKQKNVEEI